MASGRIPIPTNLRLINGNPGKQPLKTGEPKPDYLEQDRADQARDQFLTSPEAKIIWDFHYPALRRARLITEIDVMTFVRWAEAEGETWKTQKLISGMLADGQMPVTEGPNGGFVYHPALVIRNRASERAERGAREFGMTPAARTKIKAEAQLDLFADIMADAEDQKTPSARWDELIEKSKGHAAA